MIATVLTSIGPTVFASLWIVSGLCMGSVAFGIVDA